MAPPLSSLYTLSFAIAIVATLFVAATLRLLAILPSTRSKTQPWRKPPLATRVLIVLGSGGHTHEMLYLLRDLDTAKYTHRTYVVSGGDAFSAQRALEFERELEQRGKNRPNTNSPSSGTVDIKITDPNGATSTTTTKRPRSNTTGRARAGSIREPRKQCLGPDHYNIAIVPRARKIHQPLLTTPFSSLYTLYSCFSPLLGASSLAPNKRPTTPYEAAAADVPDLVITNGPATAVILILASLILRFFDIRGANSRSKCKTVYVESFARVKTLSLSGKILVRVVDRFLVQWEELEGAGGRAEFWGVLV
ncbi:glycosyltransferase family 1 protein [Plenodomus tracheiphilus IPT5]|uniref:UDP-N-acetylglucosamine transferase subunit ALG14 n=1 Tax=Plenodomus tracheiphilus IPT5 TaxID=1408161 RepID=A0A6A7B3N9_9PLEO|nr:glycosyltransferase family 1 protein [Plenodomus tracheiphilus IPT5]